METDTITSCNTEESLGISTQINIQSKNILSLTLNFDRSLPPFINNWYDETRRRRGSSHTVIPTLTALSEAVTPALYSRALPLS